MKITKSEPELTILIPTVIFKIHKQLETINVQLCCHLTPKGFFFFLFIYILFFVPSQWSGGYFDIPISKILSTGHKTETFKIKIKSHLYLLCGCPNHNVTLSVSRKSRKNSSVIQYSTELIWQESFVQSEVILVWEFFPITSCHRLSWDCFFQIGR